MEAPDGRLNTNQLPPTNNFRQKLTAPVQKTFPFVPHPQTVGRWHFHVIESLQETPA
ncbi:unnamed protein product, partial [Nesidiocoris tenuis]